MKISTHFNVYWMAVTENYCGCGECDSPHAFGRTEEEAIANLKEQLADLDVRDATRSAEG